MNKLFKHKELEQELADAKLAQISLQITQHKEQSLQEKTQVCISQNHWFKHVTELNVLEYG